MKYTNTKKPMKTTLLSNTQDRIIRYFEASGMDYAQWSPQFNMHFGYYAPGMNPFKREAMLNRLSEEVFKRLSLSPATDGLVLDFGCGLGATARHMAKSHPFIDFYGITLTPWQVKYGQKLSKAMGVEERIQLLEANFTNTPLADGCADGLYAIESACYAPGADKENLVREIHRVLKPGARFALADGFRKHSRRLPAWLNNIYRRNLNCWALEELADVQRFVATLKKFDFSDIRVEEVSWSIATSFAHNPFVT